MARTRNSRQYQNSKPISELTMTRGRDGDGPAKQPRCGIALENFSHRRICFLLFTTAPAGLRTMPPPTDGK